MTTKEFISRAKFFHKNKYEYSKVEYFGGLDFVTIICPIHGEFQQQPAIHLNSSGCRKCNINQPVETTTADYIAKAKLIHKDSYDYSSTVFQRDNLFLSVICRTHGLFRIMARVHLQGKGCSSCKKS